jgi:hypothetical protein
MTKKGAKAWMSMAAGALLLGGGVIGAAASRTVRAQDEPAPSMTPAEALTVALLQTIVVELQQLNEKVERFPAVNAQ